MELLNVYDENNEFLNKKLDREEIHNKGLWHHEVLIIVINEKKQVLLQKRSYKRRNLPGKWALCAGHVISDETEKKTAVRELKEEIGLTVSAKDLKLIDIYKKNEPKNRKFSYIYLVKTTKKINEFKIQTNELTQIKYVPIKKLIKMILDDDKHLVFGGDEYHLQLFTNILHNTI